MNQPNDKFTLPPSPKIETSQVDKVPEIKEEIQRNEVNLSRDTNSNGATEGNSLPAESSGNTLSPESTEGEIIDAIQQASITSDSSILPPQRSESGDRSLFPNANLVNPRTQATTEEPEISTEEKEIKEVKIQYKLTPKFNKWCELFFDKSKDSKTYLNKTQSALAAYNLDPKKQYFVASKIGQQNYEKLSNVASEIADNKGYTFEKFVDIAWVKVLKSDSPEWWDRFGDMVGFRSMKPTTVINAQTQNNTIINVPEGEKKTFNDQFRDFVKNS